MTTEVVDQSRRHRRKSTLPPLPMPVRLLNRVGGAIRNSGLASSHWTADDLIVDAITKTGYSDFGAGELIEPLEHLVASIHEEARLSTLGNMLIRWRLVGVLCNRLRAEAMFASTPQIEEIFVHPPIVIAGLQRTGTTLLHRLLAVDPSARAVASWEAMNPAPLPPSRWSKVDPRVSEAKRNVSGLKYMSPEFFRIHPLDAYAPEEEVMLLEQSVLSTVPEALMHVPSFGAWLERQDHTPAYVRLRRLLQLLHWQSPGPDVSVHWVLKTPHHLEFLNTLRGVFPNAVVVQTHRDPLRTVPSLCSLVAHASAVFSDEVDTHAVGRRWSRKVGRMIERSLSARADMHDHRFVDVAYADLLRDPIAEVERIYAAAGRELSSRVRAAMLQFIKQNPKDKHGSHRYTLDEFGLTRDEVERATDAYRRRYSIPYE